ncbi:MAG: hypothetical protein AVDCRST_MAG31-933, partial [uncultured Sphingomonas sp.]
DSCWFGAWPASPRAGSRQSGVRPQGPRPVRSSCRAAAPRRAGARCRRRQRGHGGRHYAASSRCPDRGGRRSGSPRHRHPGRSIRWPAHPARGRRVRRRAADRCAPPYRRPHRSARRSGAGSPGSCCQGSLPQRPGGADAAAFHGLGWQRSSRRPSALQLSIARAVDGGLPETGFAGHCHRRGARPLSGTRQLALRQGPAFRRQAPACGL